MPSDPNPSATATGAAWQPVPYHATITLAYHGLELRCPSANLREDRPLTPADTELLTSFAATYQQAIRRLAPAPKLLHLGRQIFAWLNGPAKFLDLAATNAPAPLHILFATAKDDDTPAARAFLDAPWELLATTDHWALRPDKLFCPIRRIGAPIATSPANPPPQPSTYRLNLVFMAAAPRGADNLNYEAEEASILTATRDLGLDLTVEESGELSRLSAAIAREHPDAVQISCHGALKPEPVLLLEDETGDRSPATATQLVSQLASHRPGLLVLSACHTAESDPVLDSLARSLVRTGIPAVLGWAAPVRDNEATIFAAALYRHLAGGKTLPDAQAFARLDLEKSNQLAANPTANEPRSHDWHLARLYLSPTGGVALATPEGPRRTTAQGRAVKTFLDAKGQVPVASEYEFVGRRREIQTILREFRAPASQRHAGVLVHGMGRQGKSSLAARIAHRLENTHEPVVLYGRYDAAAIVSAIAERLAAIPAVSEIAKRHLPYLDGETNQSNLLAALSELLEGPCRQRKTDRKTRPILLVLDDFEQALEPQASGPHTVKAPLVEATRAVIRAFNDADTESKLLITSRYAFTLPSGPADLAQRLLHLPLHGMDPHESRKQATAKLTDSQRQRKNFQAVQDLVPRITKAASGNPGLQDLLFSLGLDDPAACRRCLAQMEQYQQEQKSPTEEKLQEFFKNLLVDSLLALLSPAQKDVLRAATLFQMPVPKSVIELLPTNGPETAGHACLRLIQLGLFETFESGVAETALAINALIRPLAGDLSDEEKENLARLVAAKLFECWGGEAGVKSRNYLQSYELTRLGLLAESAPIVAADGAYTLRYLDQEFDYRHAATMATAITKLLDAKNTPASIQLLRSSAAALIQVGEVIEGQSLLARAVSEIESGIAKGSPVSQSDHGATLLTLARLLRERGDPDQSLNLLEQARTLLPGQREKAIVLSEIARLRATKGEVDAAILLHNEALAVSEELGDKRSRAITLGDIARLRANKGDVDAALLLHQERLAVHEQLGDKRSRAITLGDIARLQAQKGDVDAALLLHNEELTVYESLGDKRSRAVTLGDIARLQAQKGDVDAALLLHNEELTVYESLGDKRSRAITLGDIAVLQTKKGEADAALQLHQEGLTVYESLGDKRSRAVTLWEIAKIHLRRGDFANATKPLTESYQIGLQAGYLDIICVVGLDIGELLIDAGQKHEAQQILARSRAGFVQAGWPKHYIRRADALLALCSDPTP